MEIHELTKEQQLIEFYSKIIESNTTGIYVTPYIFDNKPLEMNITIGGDIVCNLFADNPYDGKRISWRNIELRSTDCNGTVFYGCEIIEPNKDYLLYGCLRRMIKNRENSDSIVSE